MHALRWLALAVLLAGTVRCGQGSPQQLTAATQSLKATATTEHVRVYLIDGKAGGKSCTAKAVAVPIDLSIGTPALQGSLEALLAQDRTPYDLRTGYYNALHASPLTLEKIERRGAEAVVRLNGYLELDDPCDGERVLAQLQETVLQFPEIQHAQFYLEGKPLQEALAGR